MSEQTMPIGQPLPVARTHWVNFLARHAHAIGDQPAIIFEGSELTWRQFADRVGRLAAALAGRGIGFGDRVAIITGNRPEFIETMLAANMLGAMAVPINFRLTAPEAGFILEDSEAGAVVVDAIGLPIAHAALGSTERIILIGADTAGDGAGTGGPGTGGAGAGAGSAVADYESLIRDAAQPAVPGDIPESTPALLMYTSGTTGRPKGAVLTFLNLHAQSLTLIRAYQFASEGERSLVASPMFHIGAIGSIAPTILVGGTIVIAPTRTFEPSEHLDLIVEHRITNTFYVPTQWQALCAHQAAAPRELPDLRILGWGAAPASDTLLEEMARRFPTGTMVALFGQTEMSPVTCVLEGTDARRKLGSVGKPVATVAARVVDPLGADVEPGQIGEIVYRGPNMMTGYWKRPEATAEAFRDGWFHSGDLVRVDEEGFVYIVDRAKDMIISGGENIYSTEVENALAAHPDIAEVSVIGVPHPRWGETPIAVVVLREGAAELSIESLREWAGGRLARYKLPTALEIRTAMPRNATGKILKGELRAAVTGTSAAVHATEAMRPPEAAASPDAAAGHDTGEER